MNRKNTNDKKVSLSKRVLLLLAAMFASTSFNSSADAQAGSNRPVLFVHGFSVFGVGEDCSSDWSKMEAGLQSAGFTGPMVTVGYYANDKNCDANASPTGTVATPTIDSTRDFAWYIYNTYSASGTTVDIVAHSFGGLLARYALYRVAIGDPSFPPFLNVNHVTTMGSPFNGYALAAELCHVNFNNVECDEMQPGSALINELNSPAASLPQGVNGTTWSNAGSNADIFDSSDLFVGSSSATDMTSPGSRQLVLPWYKFVFHSMYTKNGNVISWTAGTLADVSASAMALKADLTVPAVTEAANVTVSKAHVTQDVSRLPASQKPAKISPYLVNGVQAGVQFTKVLAGGMFDEMGIRENDVVQGCTAATINTPSFPVEGLAKQGKGKMKLCIVRNGKKLIQVVAVQ